MSQCAPMISGRGCDKSLLAFIFGQAENGICCAAKLETTRWLSVFKLEKTGTPDRLLRLSEWISGVLWT